MGGTYSHGTDENIDMIDLCDDFRRAAKTGNTAFLTQVFERGEAKCKDIATSTDNFGNTALHLASQYGQIAAIKILLKNGADVHGTNHDGQNCLHMAIASKQLKVVQELLRTGADTNAPRTKSPKLTPLMIAIQSDFNECVTVLLQKGANANIPRDDGKTVVDMVIDSENVPIFYTLLKHGNCNDLPRYLEPQNKRFSDSPKHQIMEFLLKNNTRASPYALERATAVVVVQQAHILAEQLFDAFATDSSRISKDLVELCYKYCIQIFVSFLVQTVFPHDSLVGQIEGTSMSSEKKRQLRETLSDLLNNIDEEFIDHELCNQADWESSISSVHGRVWILDAVDNFSSFQNRKPYCVSVILLDERRPVVGALNCPRGYESRTQKSGFIQSVERGFGGFTINPLIFEESPWPSTSNSEILGTSVVCCIKRAKTNPLIEVLQSLSEAKILLSHSVEGLALYSEGHIEGFIELFSTCPAHTTMCIRALGILYGWETGGVVTDLFGDEVLLGSTAKTQQLGMIVARARVGKQMVEILRPREVSNTPPIEHRSRLHHQAASIASKPNLSPQKMQRKPISATPTKETPQKSRPITRVGSPSPLRNARSMQQAVADPAIRQSPIKQRASSRSFKDLLSEQQEVSSLREGPALGEMQIVLPGAITSPPTERRVESVASSFDSQGPPSRLKVDRMDDASVANPAASQKARHIVDIPQTSPDQRASQVALSNISASLNALEEGSLRRDDAFSEDESSVDSLLNLLRERTASLGPQDPQVITIMIRLAGLFQSLQQYQRAGNYYSQVLERLTSWDNTSIESISTGAFDVFDVMHNLDDMALQCAEGGDHRTACYFYGILYDSMCHVLGEHNPATAHPLESMASCCISMNDLHGAVRCFEEALKVRTHPGNPVDVELAKLFLQIAHTLSSLQDIDGAEKYYAEVCFNQIDV
eukprot:TRINITY_DN3437_c0_g1_i5.p1 TRINITY_DN3437_c0_g1~~TRINITY_DN3437_c0_g1_i5.p1  ORF type:complete len:937 (-),score=162.20 TRINITY_DN3437_c0_g1_i5:80-2890(-)